MKNGWQTKTLGEVLQKTETVNPLQSPEAEFDYIDVSSVSNATFQIEATQRLKGKEAPSRARKVVRTNDVLFATIRPTLQRIAIVPEHLDKQVCSTGYFVLRAKPAINHRFIFYSLFTETFIGQMESLQKGASYPAVTDSDVKAQVIPVPPLPEQQRVVGILDEAFDSIAIAKTNAEKNLLNAHALLISHLQSIFTHRGEGWVDKPLGALCSFENGDRGTNYPSKSARTVTGIPFINAGHLTDQGIDLETMNYISEERFNLLGSGKIRAGDLLFCLRGSLGKFASVGNISRGAIASSLVIVRPNKSILNGYLLAYFGSDLCSKMINQYKNGAAQPNLSAQSLSKFIVPVPPLPVQESIVAKLDAFKEKIQRFQSLCQQKLAALEALKKSLLQRAFAGELTDQSRGFVVISFPTRIPNITTTDLHAGILAMAYQLHEKKNKVKHYGHVKAEKIAHMVEAYVGIDLERAPVKDAAGPNDYPHLVRVEHRARKAGFFDFQRVEGAGYRVKKYRHFEELIERTREKLAERSRDVDSMLELMLPMNTQQAEIFSTVYAAWNNLLLERQQPSDESIVFEARENWHPEKLKIPRTKFFDAIDWIRAKGIVPSGKGKKVTAKA
jgi:type I restriction enzyme S subunit